jgi:hypothetical protein
MQATRLSVRPDLERVGIKTGYLVAIVVNAVMLVIVQNILEWGWLGFLTPEFDDLVPLVSFSLGFSVLVNLVYLSNDAPRVRATGDIGMNLVSLLVTYQIYQVFPFDFTAYEFNWAVMARVVLILAMVGCGIGIITSALRLAKGEPANEGR